MTTTVVNSAAVAGVVLGDGVAPGVAVASDVAVAPGDDHAVHGDAEQCFWLRFNRILVPLPSDSFADPSDATPTTMTSLLSAACEQEYRELQAFMAFHAEHLCKISMAAGTAASADTALTHDAWKGLEGLRQRAREVIEQLSYVPAAEVARIDQALAAAGVLTLSGLRHRYAAAYARIIRRGRIRGATEFQLVNGIVRDPSNFVSGVERLALQKLLNAEGGAG